jgi:hypothetical protein
MRMQRIGTDLEKICKNLYLSTLSVSIRVPFIPGRLFTINYITPQA